MSKPDQQSFSFTTRISLESYQQIEQAKSLGGWNTNQLMNHALVTFFEIIESKDSNPELPLVVQTLRQLRKRSRR